MADMFCRIEVRVYEPAMAPQHWRWAWFDDKEYDTARAAIIVERLLGAGLQARLVLLSKEQENAIPAKLEN